ncbi:diacylglycerol kinase [Wolinella succinogenes]|uniref:Diacylglycerol kinase n=1 Tax=Wolinella succinogenes (strain ATCC 29543 / DSM 1740 / CCUG 13145 / JCM 31913 / LMG 7466 / NCTC 11488 / FDC 602W) TaxID=273121 RepID=Q7M9V4_WOLSU|nr:diacylglycerol kinase [Wolinella succinogenes]CAE09773.1 DIACYLGLYCEROL KINASE [Wolinella succinogenes]VEG81988.1 Diacylglycerol kinase [Wolinella succinogenes]HCZ19393.1 diacylglycerol kinase [Helicobacter sp.]
MKPSYHLFKNSGYALKGLLNLWKSEVSFRIEAGVVCFGIALLGYLELDFWSRLILAGSLWQILIAEAINSSIERVVDMISPQYHPQAGIAKDVGSAIVLLTIVLTLGIWASILWRHLG